jgi:hypothetical protein
VQRGLQLVDNEEVPPDLPLRGDKEQHVLCKQLTGLIFAGLLTLSAVAAEVVVRIAPPAPVVETRGVMPGPRYVWIGGYHRWNGTAYAWVPGRWELPPRAHVRWVPHHWVRRNGGWVFVEGHWR